MLQVQGANIGSVEWKLHALPLLTAHANVDVKVTRIDGFAQTQLSVGPTGTMSFKSLAASLPLSALPANAIPGGWAGTLNGRFSAAHAGKRLADAGERQRWKCWT